MGIIKQAVRDLRKNQTESEDIFWNREFIIKKYGYNILRISNDEILTNIEFVTHKLIASILHNSPPFCVSKREGLGEG